MCPDFFDCQMAEAEDNTWSLDEEAKDGRQVAGTQCSEAVGSLEPSVSAALGFKDMLEAALRAPEEPCEKTGVHSYLPL